MPETIVAQLTEEWFQQRIGMITSSVAAGCLGWHPYQSRQKAWRMIQGTEPPQANPHIWRGNNFEASARQDYEVLTGNLVTLTGLWQHPICDWLGASPDGLIGSDGVAEIKCPMEAPERPRLHHRVQCLIHLACTERLWCDLYYWAPNGPRVFRIYRAGIPGLIVRLQQFHEEYVVTGIVPPRKRRKKS